MATDTHSTAPKIEPSWLKILENEFNKPYFTELKQFLLEEKKTHTVFPPGNQIFRAFNTTPVQNVKVVLIGQDPYHGTGQAEGLSFSVARGIKPPPSLVNIYKELQTDLGCPVAAHGSLMSWAEQGVLLLNSVLTVRSGEPASHRNRGWETFTDEAIKALAAERENLVFMLWGKFAQGKELLIDTERHLILKAAHPSPYSASAGFFGCRHFSKANAYLVSRGKEPVNWLIS